MCTVTMWRDEAQVLIGMNRDEKRTRAKEAPPYVSEFKSIRMVAPRDGESGGTWIGVSDKGVVACLLNRYGVQKPRVGSLSSRGAIIPSVLASGDWDRCLDTIRLFDPSPYDGFTLLVASLYGARVWRWERGRAWSEECIDNGWSILTSSSWNTDAVEAARLEAFEAWVQQRTSAPTEAPSEFHLESWEGREEWSPLMSRPDSCTRSLTRVLVRHEALELIYAPIPLQPASARRVRLPARTTP